MYRKMRAVERSIDLRLFTALKEKKYHTRLLDALSNLGNWWAMVLAVLLYVKYPNSAVILITAILLSAALARGLALIIGRTRPYAAPTNAADFHFLQGWAYAQTALPSSHAVVAFAVAAAADRITPPAGLKTVLLYSLASITAFARVYQEKHWLTDVLLGGAIGYYVGKYVSSYAGNSI